MGRKGREIKPNEGGGERDTPHNQTLFHEERPQNTSEKQKR